MTDGEYRNEINIVKSQFGAIAEKSNVGVVVPACMEIILNAVLSIGDKDAALAATQSLRPMIDHIEGQLRGTH